MTWEQLQQLIAEAGEGWRLYPGDGGVWVLDRPDVGKNLMFTTPEELVTYLRDYALKGDQAPTPSPMPSPAPTNPIQAIRDWFAGLGEGGTPAPAPNLGGQRPPKPPNWDAVSGGRTWEEFFPLIKGVPVFNFTRASEFDRIYNKLDEYNAKLQPGAGVAPPMPTEAPAAGYEWYWDGNQYAQRKISQKAPAKRPPYADGPEYRGPDAQGNTWYQTGPDDEWQLLSQGKARTLTEALTQAILADKPDQAEIDRLMGIINQVEASSPNFIANEQQRAFQNQLALRDQALQEQKAGLQRQQAQVELARSPGDWLTWWSMMNKANQPTAQQFQQFGADRFAPAAAGMFQPQTQPAAPQPAPQAQGMFAPPASQPGVYGQPQFQAAQQAVQDEVEQRYQAWLGQAQGAMPPEGLTPDILASARAGIEAQVKKEFPLPNMFTPAVPQGGTAVRVSDNFSPEQNAMLDASAPSDRQAYIEGFRRMNAQAGYPVRDIEGYHRARAGGVSQPQSQANMQTPAQAGGLDWLKVARSGQPIPQQRLAPNIPGVPAFPNPQTWGNLLPSQQDAYKASVEMQGIPFADYWKQYQEQIPKGYAVAGMFKARPNYIRR